MQSDETMKKQRLDLLLVEKGLAESRTLAQKLIMAGSVRVNGNMVIKPAVTFSESDAITVDHGPRFVSRGGEKLIGALESFNLTDLSDLTCVDVGSSTGGFTDCMLQHGAKKVYAIDVGYGLLHWKLRQDARVTVMEKTNARDVRGFPEPVQLAVVDASFISLRIILPVIRSWFAENSGTVLALIKPQFEAGRDEAARGAGVIRDSAVHKRVLREILSFAQETGWGIAGLARSPLKGPKGNSEFFVRLTTKERAADIDRLVREALRPRSERSDADGDVRI